MLLSDQFIHALSEAIFGNECICYLPNQAYWGRSLLSRVLFINQNLAFLQLQKVYWEVGPTTVKLGYSDVNCEKTFILSVFYHEDAFYFMILDLLNLWAAHYVYL